MNMSLFISRVGQWLLALADPAGPAGKLPSRRLMADEPEHLCRLAGLHGVLPAVAENLSRVVATRGAGCILRRPADAERELAAALARAEDQRRKLAALSLVIRMQRKELTEALADKAVPAVVLKGEDFADRLYSRPELRPFSDLDLLVPRRCLEEAAGVLRRLGYQSGENSMKYADGYGEQTWRRPGQPGSKVEVHWNLVNSPTLRRGVSVEFEDLLLEDAAPAAGGQPRLAPCSLLLVAAVHAAASHSFDRLQWLYDVAHLLGGAAGGIDEAWLAEAARKTGGARALSAALDLTGRALCRPECGRLLDRLGISPPPRVFRIVLSRGGLLRGHAKIDSFRRQLFRFWLKKR
jgi:hypothetical protein